MVRPSNLVATRFEHNSRLAWSNQIALVMPRSPLAPESARLVQPARRCTEVADRASNVDQAPGSARPAARVLASLRAAPPFAIYQPPNSIKPSRSASWRMTSTVSRRSTGGNGEEPALTAPCATSWAGSVTDRWERTVLTRVPPMNNPPGRRGRGRHARSMAVSDRRYLARSQHGQAQPSQQYRTRRPIVTGD